MAETETIDLVFRADTSVITTAAAATEVLSRAIEGVASASRDASQAELSYVAATGDMETKVNAAGEAVGRLSRFKRDLAAASGQATGSSGELNLAITHLTRAFQDFSAAGFLGISNNVEELIRSFGTLKTSGIQAVADALMGPAGLLVALQALVLFGPKLFDFFRSFIEGKASVSSFDEQIKALKDSLKEFEDKRVKVAFDYDQIDEIKRQIKDLEAARDAVERALGAQSKAERESGRRIEEGIAAVPGAQDALEQAIRQQAVAARQQDIDRLRARAAQLKEQIGIGGEGTESLQGEYFAIQDEIARNIELLERDRRIGSDEGRARVGAVLNRAKSGREEDQRKAQEELARLFAATGTEAGEAMAKMIWNSSAVKVAQEEAAKEAKREADRQRQEARQTTDPLAQDLVKGIVGTEFLRGVEITPERIRAELARTLPADTAAKLAGPVFEEFQKEIVNQVAAQARQGGVDLDEARRQLAERREAATPEAKDAAARARQAIAAEEARQKDVEQQFKFLQPDIISSLRKGAAQGVEPAEAQQRVAEAVAAELVRRGVEAGTADAAAQRLIMAAEAGAPAAEAAVQDRQVREQARQQARLVGREARAEGRGFEAAIPQIEMGLLGGRSQEDLANAVAERMRAAGGGAEANQAARDLVAKAAGQLSATYGKYFAAVGDKDRATMLTMQELARTQLMAAANQQAMAAGFESIRAQQRAIQQQLQRVGKPFQLPGRQ